MAEDTIQQSGNDTQQGGETYTKEAVDKLLEDARKEAATGVYRKFQSDKDKEIAEIRKAAEADKATLAQKLQEHERTKFEAMSPEEQSQYMIRQMYDRVNGQGAQPSSKPDSPTADRTPEPVVPADDPAAQVKETVGSVLKEMGYDSTKVDWADGETDPQKAMKRFVQSILSQKAQAEKPNEDDIDANRTSTTKGAAPVNDISKIDPLDLIKQGYQEKGRFRGR